MGSRTRERVLARCAPGARRVYLFGSLNSTTIGNTQPTSLENCADTTSPSPYPDHALTLTKRWSDPLTISGSVTSGIYRTEYDGYTVPDKSQYSSTPNPSVVGWAYYRTKFLANVNPSNPTVDVPVFLFELRDFPRMLKQAGDVLRGKTKPSDAAGAYVAYSFGWAPLISDVSKLVGLSKVVNDRFKYLSKISAKGGARIKRKLEDTTNTLSTAVYTVSPPTGSIQNALDATQVTTERMKVWGVARVASHPSPVQLDDPNMLAARSALGLNVSAASLWEALPWSWLIDYFVNVGDYLDATRGFINSSVTGLNLMCTQELVNTLNYGKIHTGLSISGGNMYCTRKSRSVSAVPVPSLARRPWFTPHMAGILGSLATAKALKRIGR